MLFSFKHVFFTPVSTVPLTFSLNTHLLRSCFICLSYCVIDTNLSNEAVMKLKLSCTLKLANPMLINFSEFWAMTSFFSDYSTSQHSVLANVHHNFSL